MTTKTLRHHYYDPPEDLAYTVFDPCDETFGPIMRAIQTGNFESARDLLADLGAFGACMCGLERRPRRELRGSLSLLVCERCGKLTTEGRPGC
jgi:hypothetical protein